MSNQSAMDIDMIISVDEKYLSQLDKIAENLRSQGLKDIQVLTGVGVITGKGHSDLLSALRQVNGVAAVETAGTVQIAPPGSDVQ